MPSGNSKGSKIRHGTFWELIFGAGILLGFNFYPHSVSRHALEISELQEQVKMENAYHKPDEKTLQALQDIATKLRIHSIESTNAAGSGYVFN